MLHLVDPCTALQRTFVQPMNGQNYETLHAPCSYLRDNLVTHKGRVAAEIQSADELVLTELIFNSSLKARAIAFISSPHSAKSKNEFKAEAITHRLPDSNCNTSFVFPGLEQRADRGTGLMFCVARTHGKGCAAQRETAERFHRAPTDSKARCQGKDNYLRASSHINLRATGACFSEHG